MFGANKGQGSLFGGAGGTPAGGGMFGGAAGGTPVGGGMFGAPKQPASIFGAPTPQGTAGAQPLFGNPGASSFGGLFGGGMPTNP